MPDHTHNTPEGSQDTRMNLPSREDGGVGDNTVASPVLGFGMDRVDKMEEQPAAPKEPQTSVPQHQAPVAGTPENAPDPLMRNEVAAVDVSNRAYYVGDTPSPYLSSRQAHEDVEVTKRRHSRIVTVLVTLFIIGILGAGGWFLWSTIKPNTPQNTVRYETMPIEKGEYLESLQSTSLIRPINEEQVTSGISGTIAESFVENGATVEEGQQLFRLENPTITDATRRAREALETFSQEVDRKADALNKANEELAKAQEQANKSNASTSSSSASSTPSTTNTAANTAVENATKRVQIAQTEYDAARQNEANIQETYNHALEQEELLNVHAPIAGTVSEVCDQAASSGTVSGSTRLCTIADTSAYSLSVEIPQSERERVSEGQEVRLTFPSIKDLAITSTINSIDPVDENNETFVATINIENPDEHITNGLAVEATVVLKSIPNSYIVPSNTVRTNKDGSTHLDVLLDPTRGIVTDVPVRVISNDGTKAAIEADNIQEGNSVLIVGQLDQQQQQQGSGSNS